MDHLENDGRGQEPQPTASEGQLADMTPLTKSFVEGLDKGIYDCNFYRYLLNVFLSLMSIAENMQLK